MKTKVRSKLFTKFANIDDNCQTYLKVYDKIISRLVNKNGHK